MPSQPSSAAPGDTGPGPGPDPDTGAPTAPPAASTPPSAPPAPPAPLAAASEAVVAPTGAKRTYRAAVAMGGVRSGGTFEATDDDPRVKSGYAQLVEDDKPEVPDEVAEAFGNRA